MILYCVLFSGKISSSSIREFFRDIICIFFPSALIIYNFTPPHHVIYRIFWRLISPRTALAVWPQKASVLHRINQESLDAQAWKLCPIEWARSKCFACHGSAFNKKSANLFSNQRENSEFCITFIFHPRPCSDAAPSRSVPERKVAIFPRQNFIIMLCCAGCCPLLDYRLHCV